MTRARSLANRASDIVSVRDFGAVGDGVADDTAAFVAARDYVASVQGVLNIPAGTYRLQQATSLKANNTKWVFAPGAVLKLVDTQATTSFLTFSSPVNQRVYGMRVNANRPVQNAALFGVDNCAVLVVDATNCTFDDIEIINSPAKGFALVSSPTNFCRDVSITNFTGADCAQQVLIVDGNNITGFFERIVIDNVKIGTTSSYGLCLNDGAGQVSVSNVIAELNNTAFDAVFIRDSFDLQLSNIRGSSARCGVSIQRLNGYTGRIELSNIIGEFNEQHGVLLFGAENVTGSQIVGLNNKQTGINISQTGASYRCKNINLSNCSAYDNRGTPVQQYGLIVQGVDGCRIGTLLAYGNTTRNMSINRAVTSDVQAPTRQVVSGTTGSIAAGANAVITLNWPTPFDDASVDIESAYVSVATSSLSLSVTHIVAVTQNAVQVMVRNLGASAFTGTLTVAGTRTV